MVDRTDERREFIENVKSGAAEKDGWIRDNLLGLGRINVVARGFEVEDDEIVEGLILH